MTTRYVIRDFTTVLGIDGPTFAIVHVGDHAWCEVLLGRDSVHYEAHLRDNGIGLSGSEYTYEEADVDAAEAAHCRRFEVEFTIKRHECVDRHEKWRAEQAVRADAPVADDTMVRYHGSLTEFHGQRLSAARCCCREGDCFGYELEDPATDVVLLRHVRRRSITPVEAA